MSEHTTSKAGNSSPARTFGQLWQVPTLLLGLLCLGFVAANSKLRHDPAAAEFHAELAQLRQAVDDRGCRIQPWLDKSTELLAMADRFPAHAAETYFLVGSLFWRASEEAETSQAVSQRSKAEEYLEKALDSKNVVDKDLSRLKYRLGMVLYRQGQALARAVELMEDGLNHGADVGGSGYEFLLQAILKQTNPNLQKAQELSRRWLERCDNEETQARARFTRAELLMRCDNRPEAVKVLEPVCKSPIKEFNLKAQYLQACCFEADKHWRQARRVWEGLLKEADSVPGGKGRILYSLGLCTLNDDSNQLPTALGFWNQALALGGDEAQAAALRIGEAQLAGDVDAALRAWTEALSQVHKADDYRNPHVPLDQVREMIESAQSSLMDRKSYEAAGKLADLYERVAQPGKAELNRAQAYEALAQSILAQRPAAAEAGPFFEKAGLAYEQTALSSPAADQAEYYWRAADCFKKAGKHKQTVHVLQEFVKKEKSSVRVAEGWLDLAEARCALGQAKEARDAFYNCINIPGTPSADRARYRLAVEEKNVKNFDKAIDYLKKISPQSVNRAALEDAMFLHGSLLMDLKKYADAEYQLEQAIREAHGHPAAFRARAELADCCRKQAAVEMEYIPVPRRYDQFEQIHINKWQEKLNQAINTYKSLVEELETRARTTHLSTEQLALLREANFGVANLHLELGDVDGAVSRFQWLQDHYPRQVEGLIACEGIVRCGMRAKSPAEVMKLKQIIQASIRVAEDDLRMMDGTSPVFREPADVRSKQKWQDWINDVKNSLAKISGGAQPSK